MNKPTRIIVHCTASPPDLDLTAAQIDAMHKRRGWSGIGYHAIVRLDGTEEIGRDPDGDGDPTEHVGAHVYGHNRDTLAVSYVGGVDDRNWPADTRTEPQKETLFAIVVRWMERFEIPVDKVLGHYELDRKKACPSFDMGEFRTNLERRMKQRAPGAKPSRYAKKPIDAVALGEHPARLPILRNGSRGQAVAAAQAMLHRQGYQVVVTALFDDEMSRAVHHFQRDQGLHVDGVIGAHETWPALILREADYVN
jgi:hypothetical protein